MEKRFSKQMHPEQVEVVTFTSDKKEFKPKLEETKMPLHINEGKILQVEAIIVNLYTPNIGTFNFIKQTLLYI
jgi:hypothetical protein